MTDAEIDQLARAFRTVVQEQGIELRALLADARADTEALRADLQYEKALAVEFRRAAAESQTRMLTTLASSLGDVLRMQTAPLVERMAVLEQRAMQAAQ